MPVLPSRITENMVYSCGERVTFARATCCATEWSRRRAVDDLLTLNSPLLAISLCLFLYSESRNQSLRMGNDLHKCGKLRMPPKCRIGARFDLESQFPFCRERTEISMRTTCERREERNQKSRRFLHKLWSSRTSYGARIFGSELMIL